MDVHVVYTVQVENTQPTATTHKIVWELSPGYLQTTEKLAFGHRGWLAPVRRIPLEVVGTFGILVHAWDVLRSDPGFLGHVWQVCQAMESGQLPHVWNILTEENRDCAQLWRVLRNEIVLARSRDIQLPYATKTITPGEQP